MFFNKRSKYSIQELYRLEKGFDILLGNIKLFDFQEKAVINLIDLSIGSHKQTITVKSPTGSGKTIILINYICNYFKNFLCN